MSQPCCRPLTRAWHTQSQRRQLCSNSCLETMTCMGNARSELSRTTPLSFYEEEIRDFLKSPGFSGTLASTEHNIPASNIGLCSEVIISRRAKSQQKESRFYVGSVEHDTAMTLHPTIACRNSTPPLKPQIPITHTYKRGTTSATTTKLLVSAC